MIRYLHTICTHLRKIEENKRYYLKRKYYLWAWKSRGMYMKRNRIQIIENQIFATHNLEVPGSSPGWSTKNCLINKCLWGFFIRTSSLWIFEILTRNRLFCFVVDLLLTPK